AATAFAHFYAGRYSDAVRWAEMSLVERPNHVSGIRALAASYAMTERQDEAARTVAHLRELDPALRLSNLKDVIPLRRAEDFDRLVEALRKAGLPE
ncbi:MAG TPA: adenylate cyclase, partial [Alphaproteobacteria bacterium]